MIIFLLLALAEESNSDDDKTSTHTSESNFASRRKERVKFSHDDKMAIMAHFGMLITADRSENVTEKAFIAVLSKPEVKELLQRFDETTLLSKVRTERKMFLKEKQH